MHTITVNLTCGHLSNTQKAHLATENKKIEAKYAKMRKYEVSKKTKAKRSLHKILYNGTHEDEACMRAAKNVSISRGTLKNYTKMIKSYGFNSKYKR